MDRHRRRSLALGAGAALILTGLAAAEGFALRAMGWLAPGADPAAVLTVEPAECLTLFTDAAHRASVEIGRAAFRTPVLLGGQAARAGLSCESCHRGGRSNAGFLFPGVSGRPGTADVTSSLFSSHRGDGVDDPLPIPDLAGDRARLKVAPGALAPFIHGLIVEEFDGPEPPPAVLTGLADYVRALSPQACPAAASRAVTMSGLMDDTRRAALAAETAPDTATALVMVSAARARLGLIDERYAGPQLSAERAALRAADRRLADVAQALRAGPPNPRKRLAAWRLEASKLELQLRRREALSLFNRNSF
ncbi:hypothetical protein [Phenylobacterium sp. Root700]|uniref:hypothetical protein n=1 Tax=Phenylobacterium sp. Root700 TaxID=1736591 RepID=UPI0006FF9BFC|nr:hypothetical protein [Phenylobacterium sp. Root700]KRB43927.1 hypothetical protein ASE02_20225 [Phenylobacterium sp. Root700]